MSTHPTTPPTAPADGGRSEQPHYFWKQCYEVGDGVHWALCDTESQKAGMVSSCYMILLADYPTAMDGKPVGEQDMLVRIAAALNDPDRARLLAEVAELRGALEKIKSHTDRATKIMGTLRTETRPINGHDDPNAVEDCWRESFDELVQAEEAIASALATRRKPDSCLRSLKEGV